MQLQFDINRSLKANPPKYGKGIKFIERKVGKLSELRVMDSNGISLQPREKNLEYEQRNISHSFRVNGVLYDREVMVAELCPDGIEELISGFGRKYGFEDLGVDTYFWDVVEFESPYWKAVSKRRLNATKDHIAQGKPNTEGTFIKGLVEMKSNNSFDSTNDDAIRNALFDMSNGQLDDSQTEKLLKKFRKSNSKHIGINAYNKVDANAAARNLGLPTSGYVNDISSPAWDTVGWVYKNSRAGFKKEVISWAEKFDDYGKKIQITGYIEHTDLDEEVIKKARKSYLDVLQKTINDVVCRFLEEKYHDMVEFKGFLAQITTEDPEQGGLPKERGLVDINGNIIKESI